MPWNDGVWNDNYWNDTVYVPPVPQILPTATTIQLGDLILGQGSDPDADGVFWDWTWIDGWWDTASLRTEQSEVLSMGVTQTVGRVNGRAISLRGLAHTQHVGSKLGTLIFGADRTLKRNMWLPNKYATLTVNEPGMALQAVVTAAQPIRVQDWHEQGRAWLEFEVPLLAPDPRRYSTIIQTDSRALPPPGTATVSATITNAGDMPSPPTFTVQGPMSVLSIRNDSLGGSPSIDITFAGNFTTGQVCIVDVAARTLTIDGTDAVGLITNAQWWELGAGTNSVKFVATTGDPNTDVFVTTWRDAWS